MTDTTPPSWSNWSGRLTSEADLVHVRTEDDIVARVRAAASAGTSIRVAGASHSHMPLVPNEHHILDVSGLSGVVSADVDAKQAWLWAGTPIATLGRQLHDRGLALINQGDIDRQTIAGAAATGTHGTGRTLRNISASVVGARVVTADGEVTDCDATKHAELWQVARLNLGAIGVVTRLKLQLRDAYRLRERRSVRPYDEVEPDLADLPSRSRHYEFFWLPDRDLVVEKAIDETTDEPEYPLAGEGRRVGWNYEVLASHRPWKHTEMEYSVPDEQGPACMSAIREMVRRDHPNMPYAVEYRTVAADDVWMSTAHGRATVTISMHYDVSGDEEPLYRAAEEIFLAHDGRPHWGKINHLDGEALRAMHERWDDWWRVRDGCDPSGVFLNDYLRGIRP